MLDFLVRNWVWILFIGGIFLMHRGHGGHGSHGGVGESGHAGHTGATQSPGAEGERANQARSQPSGADPAHRHLPVD